MRRFALGLLMVLTLVLPSLPAQKAPSGKILIAFASYKDRPKYSNIFFYEHDGIATGKIIGSVGTPRSADASGHPTLSQDGQFCAFTFEIENKTSRIYFWNVKEQKLVDLPTINDAPNAQLGPSLAGDGNLIAFTAWARPAAPGPGWHVYLYDRNAKKIVETPGLNSQANDDRMPVFSGDGRFIAFASNRKGGAGLTDLYLYDRRESRLVPMPEINSKQSELEPTLNADGSLVAFASERPDGVGGRDIYLFDRMAGKFLPLPGLNTPAHEYTPALSPDGRYLAFVSERVEGAGERDIYLYDRETNKLLPTPGLNSKAEDFDPSVIIVREK